ncbi:hypothetical protein Pla52o_10490 [Novipirellula galeiformis]|uniref:Glycosyl transferases group 1 n=1 Tax=Novipirellula galeiformis TaxID=2528004 RepID=A0A5C6CTJ0_9BACT|nr:hypothetical protein [Novipirellula galeiformis]TWU27185.1 hypothetical protein Pla52o_10490 [Novipirellula galeiformis]
MKTMLISGMPPGDGGVGEILIEEMLGCDGIEPVSYAGLITQEHFDKRQRQHLTQQQCFVPPAEFARRNAPGWKGTITTISDRLRRYEPAVRQLSRDVIDFVHQESPDQIWTILNSTVTIDVAAAVRAATEVPMLVHIWDDPRDILMQRKLDRFTFARTLKRFDFLLRRADRLGVICEPMADAYAKKSQASSVIIRHGIQDSVTPLSEPTSKDEFRIGISGSMYCYSAWKAFHRALDELDWRIGRKRIVLVVAGSDIRFRAFKPAECRFYGWRSVPEVMRILTNCDALYLPHPFEPLQEPLARLSFPTKLSTYAGTGRPVLLHAPHHSSLTGFSKKHGFGLLTHDLEPSRLAEFLRLNLGDQNVLNEQSDATARIGSTILGRAQFERSTREFLAPHDCFPVEPSREVSADADFSSRAVSASLPKVTHDE